MDDLTNSGAAAPRSTLDNVAALAGVSAKTASRVLNGQPNVAADTRARVMSAAKMLRFRPNAMARELRTGASTRAVGLVIADIANPFYSQLASAAEHVFRDRNLELFLASTDEDPVREKQVVRTMLERRVQALLIVPASDDHSYLQDESELGTTMIFLDRPPRNLAADAFVSDNRTAAAELTRNLIGEGHTRIGVVADVQRASTALDRLAGVRDAFRAAGIDGEAYIRVGAHTPEVAAQLTGELLALPEPPTALIGLNNLITMGVLQGLMKSGTKAIVNGFDDLDVMNLLGVTVMTLDPSEMGRLAAERAVARLGGLDDPPLQLNLPTRMIHRDGLAGSPWARP